MPCRPCVKHGVKSLKKQKEFSFKNQKETKKKPKRNQKETQCKRVQDTCKVGRVPSAYHGLNNRTLIKPIFSPLVFK